MKYAAHTRGRGHVRGDRAGRKGQQRHSSDGGDRSHSGGDDRGHSQRCHWRHGRGDHRGNLHRHNSRGQDCRSQRGVDSDRGHSNRRHSDRGHKRLHSFERSFDWNDGCKQTNQGVSRETQAHGHTQQAA